MSHFFKKLFNKRKKPKFKELPSREKVAHLQDQLDQLKQLAMQNIDRAINRGENLEELEKKAQKLEEAAKLFKKNATTARVDYWYKNFKTKMMLTVALLGVTAVMITVLLGATGVVAGPVAFGVSMLCVVLSGLALLGIQLYQHFADKRAAEARAARESVNPFKDLLPDPERFKLRKVRKKSGEQNQKTATSTQSSSFWNKPTDAGDENEVAPEHSVRLKR